MSNRRIHEDIQWVRNQLEVLEGPHPECGMYSAGSRGPCLTESQLQTGSRPERPLRGIQSSSDQRQRDMYSENSCGPRITESVKEGAGKVSQGQDTGGNVSLSLP
ncbi:hypothetical protein CY34DRAFT_16473 [Suillus luteus UH-Slu-Lm8-n1]|uniref:Uncharacterized protein n=1 Tax=Suillus luteus UH-Slu-Lm8-n1 TaxID=930992 RepID=A0A0D0A3N4_9AGAM|nr:hypothetical protein CY34DRAFT_16473 [Suillus luteus UH-Slu-Lm8-n1]